MFRMRMPADVGKRFLHDVEYLDLAFGGKAQIRRAIHEFERDTRPVEEALAGFGERMQQPLRVHPAAEIRDEFAQPALRIAERVIDVAPELVRLQLVGATNGVAQQAHAHAHVGESLGERIVHFVGQHLPLVGKADAQVLAREARIVERHAEKIAGCLQQRCHRRRESGVHLRTSGPACRPDDPCGAAAPRRCACRRLRARSAGNRSSWPQISFLTHSLSASRDSEHVLHHAERASAAAPFSTPGMPTATTGS